MLLKSYIQRMEDRFDLKEHEAREVVRALLWVDEKKEIQDEEIAHLLKAWSAKGFTDQELVGAALAMLDRSRQAHPLTGLADLPVLLDTCGTGGDNLGTPNISTLAGLIVASVGVPVAKHGNRAATSRYGSADLLHDLGININPGAPLVARCINELRFGFLFAPTFHHATQRVALVRKTLGIKTLFNYLGPLTNPAPVTHQMVGVSDKKAMHSMAKALQRLGRKKAWVVRGQDGLDEVSLGQPTDVLEILPGGIREIELAPGSFGLPPIATNQLHLQEIGEYRSIAEKILKGKTCKPYSEIVFLNAGAALALADRVSSIREGIELAREAVADGGAWVLVENLRKLIPA